MRILTLLPFFLVQAVLADGALKTVYQWENEKGGLFDGKCIELDSETRGEMFRKRSAPENCRTENTIIAFHYPSGECVEADEETGGKNYLSKIAIEKCKTSNTVINLQTFQDSSGCFEFDFPSQGKEYYRKLKMEECEKVVKNYFFKLTESLKGECYAKDSNDELIKVKLEFCKPKKTNYEFVFKDEISGSCFEVSSEGKDYYIAKVTKKNCRPEEIDYVYIKKVGEKNGRCYLVDKKTGGKNYIELTGLLNCK